MKSAGKARNNGLYRHIRTSKEIIRNLLNDYGNIHHAKRHRKQRKQEEKTMWTEGTIRVGASVFHYWVKHYEEPSIYGYEEGRASKITLRRNAETVFNFDRGLDVPPTDAETETALAILLKQYN